MWSRTPLSKVCKFHVLMWWIVCWCVLPPPLHVSSRPHFFRRDQSLGTCAGTNFCWIPRLLRIKTCFWPAERSIRRTTFFGSPETVWPYRSPRMIRLGWLRTSTCTKNRPRNLVLLNPVVSWFFIQLFVGLRAAVAQEVGPGGQFYKATSWGGPFFSLGQAFELGLRADWSFGEAGNPHRSWRTHLQRCSLPS